MLIFIIKKLYTVYQLVIFIDRFHIINFLTLHFILHTTIVSIVHSTVHTTKYIMEHSYLTVRVYPREYSS